MKNSILDAKKKFEGKIDSPYNEGYFDKIKKEELSNLKIKNAVRNQNLRNEHDKKLDKLKLKYKQTELTSEELNVFTLKAQAVGVEDLEAMNTSDMTPAQLYIIAKELKNIDPIKSKLFLQTAESKNLFSKYKSDSTFKGLSKEDSLIKMMEKNTDLYYELEDNSDPSSMLNFYDINKILD